MSFVRIVGPRWSSSKSIQKTFDENCNHMKLHRINFYFPSNILPPPPIIHTEQKTAICRFLQNLMKEHNMNAVRRIGHGLVQSCKSFSISGLGVAHRAAFVPPPATIGIASKASMNSAFQKGALRFAPYTGTTTKGVAALTALAMQAGCMVTVADRNYGVGGCSKESAAVAIIATLAFFCFGGPDFVIKLIQTLKGNGKT